MTVLSIRSNRNQTNTCTWFFSRKYFSFFFISIVGKENSQFWVKRQFFFLTNYTTTFVSFWYPEFIRIRKVKYYLRTNLLELLRWAIFHQITKTSSRQSHLFPTTAYSAKMLPICPMSHQRTRQVCDDGKVINAIG